MSPTSDRGDRIAEAIAASPTASRLMAATFRTDTLEETARALLAGPYTPHYVTDGTTTIDLTGGRP